MVTALNLSYSDNGLFGMYTVSDGSATGKVGKELTSSVSVKGSLVTHTSHDCHSY